MDKFPVSIVVITKNEEENIEHCLKSVSWSDDIVVVDDFSSDKTAEIAKRYTDKVYQRKMDIEGIHRNWAYAKAKNDWVLSLDADEQATEELKEAIRDILKNNTQYTGFSMPLRNFIGDFWVKHGGWYPAEKLRLFRKSKFKYEEVGVHPRAFLDGKCGHLKADIIHKGYPDFGHFVNSLNRQTDLEAEKWLTDKRPMSFWRAARKGVDRFLKGFILKAGYKDGFIGFMVALFSGLYQILTYAKYRELRKRKL